MDWNQSTMYEQRGFILEVQPTLILYTMAYTDG